MSQNLARALGHALDDVFASDRPFTSSGEIVLRLRKSGMDVEHRDVVQLLRRFQAQGSISLAQSTGSDVVRVTPVGDLWRRWSSAS